MPRELTLQQRRFVASYLGGATATQAAIDSGYSAHSAKSRGHVLLTDNKLIRAEIDRVQQRLAKTADYNAEKCAAFIDTRIAKAETDKQHSAAAKYHEQKMRLFGLLIDKQHIEVADKVSVVEALEMARARVSHSFEDRVQARVAEELRLRCDSAQTIDGEFVALPGVTADRPIDQDSPAPPKGRSNRKGIDAIWNGIEPPFNPSERR